MDRHAAFEEIERRGAFFAVVRYSGGNDEGGVDGIGLFTAEGTKIGEIHSHHVWDGQVYVRDADGIMEYETVPADEERGIPEHKRPKTRAATKQELKDDEFRKALSQPVFDVWHGFAGEFYTSGEYTWDTRKRQVLDEHDEPIIAPSILGRYPW